MGIIPNPRDNRPARNVAKPITNKLRLSVSERKGTLKTKIHWPTIPVREARAPTRYATPPAAAGMAPHLSNGEKCLNWR